MQSASPGPPSMGRPSSVKVRTPSMPIPTDGLLVGVVTVRDGHLRSGGEVELEDGDGGCRVPWPRLGLDQEANR
jgi:hypothetical protein